MAEIFWEFSSNGFRFFFRKENYSKHAQKHSELRHHSMLDRVKRAITDPTHVYPDFFARGKRLCCYYKEFEVGSMTRYTKVVITKHAKRSYEIITAYRPSNIKERKYYTELNQESLEWI